MRATLAKLGPGLVTGAADDDPSGIATYSQAGAQFGLGMLWTMPLTYPLMGAIQLVSARLALVTGEGIAANLRRHYSRSGAIALVALLLVANVFNIAADLAAMAYAVKSLVGGNYHAYVLVLALTGLWLQVFVPFPRYSPILKLLTLSLLAYAGTMFMVKVPWLQVLRDSVLPSFQHSDEYALMVVAVLGTTISPYLFFWQAGQEIEELRTRGDREPLKGASEALARSEIRRIKLDTWIGMGFSNLIAFFIMLTTAVTLNAHGITNIETTAQAADALRPIAGEHAFLLYTLGLIGTGMLAIPVLAGSAAYAVAEVFDMPASLGLRVGEARGFYAVLAASVLVAIALDFNDVDPVRELFWSAVINGIISVPIMIALMLLAARRDVMGRWVMTRRHRFGGWSAVALMTAAVSALAWSWFR